MGMYDTFLLVKSIKCTCGWEQIDFQTKSLDNLMDTYKQGEPAQSYYLRGLTPEEEKERDEDLKKNYPSLYNSPIGKMCGCLTRSDEVRSKIPDGKYNCYTSCMHCNSWIEAEATIKDGIFVGIDVISMTQGEVKKNKYRAI